MAGIVEQVDQTIASFFSSWDTNTSVLCGILVVFLLWPILTGRDPDIHPYLLARQAQASPIRHPGESAVYRANEVPYGYPLRKGLAVKDAGAPLWAAGRDGDLRDIWRQAVKGPVDDKGVSKGVTGSVKVILGREQVLEQSFSEVTKSINAIGKYVQENGAKTVAVCLSNSVELLAIIFASAFYNFKPVLIPYGIPQSTLNTLLVKASADFFITEAGTVDLKAVITAAPSIKHIIWVAKEGSRHMDWNEVPEGVGSGLDVQTWHELVEDRKPSSDVPPLVKDSPVPKPVATFWETRNEQYELIEYEQANLVAGVGGLISTLARAAKLTEADILLPTTPLTESYTLCWTLAALFSGATLALTAVAGKAVDLADAVTGVRPTLVITSSDTITKHITKITSTASGLGASISAFFQKRSLDAGVMSTSTSSSFNPNLDSLRVLLISQSDGVSTRASSSVLNDLRMALGTRIGYALTTGRVAGAVTQTNILDYRDKGDVINIGAPLTCVEIHLVGDDDRVQGEKPIGNIVVRGPSVVGGRIELGVPAKIDGDHTFELQ